MLEAVSEAGTSICEVNIPSDKNISLPPPKNYIAKADSVSSTVDFIVIQVLCGTLIMVFTGPSTCGFIIIF